MTRYVSFICVIVAVSVSQGVPESQIDSLLSLLPTETMLTGWSTVDTARTFRGEELFHLIDGGADLFFEYGFRQALAIEHQNTGGESIKLELYEMNDPGAAYGIYSIRIAEGATPVDIGQEGSAHSYYIMFWKGRYYVSITGSDSTLECRKGLEGIARGVDRNITELGQKPLIVGLLPEENLVKRRYIRGYLGMSTIRVFDEKDIFHSAEGAIGTYHDHTMMIVRYGSAPEADRRLAGINAYLKSNRRFKDYEYRDRISTVTDNKRRVLAFGQSAAYLVVAVSSDESVARASCTRGMMVLGED